MDLQFLNYLREEEWIPNIHDGIAPMVAKKALENCVTINLNLTCIQSKTTENECKSNIIRILDNRGNGGVAECGNITASKSIVRME